MNKKEKDIENLLISNFFQQELDEKNALLKLRFQDIWYVEKFRFVPFERLNTAYKYGLLPDNIPLVMPFDCIMEYVAEHQDAAEFFFDGTITYRNNREEYFYLDKLYMKVIDISRLSELSKDFQDFFFTSDTCSSDIFDPIWTAGWEHTYIY